MQPILAHGSSAPFAAPRLCTQGGCAGIVLRHSLGCAQAVRRCTRCFRSYDAIWATESESPTLRMRMARAWTEFRAWREGDE